MSDSAGSLRERVRAAAAGALLDSAERAIIRTGYERTTMQEIASEAGCAAGTFYLYFKNKEELFEAIVARHADAIFSLARAALAAEGPPLERIRSAWLAMLGYTKRQRAFFRIFFTVMPMRHRGLNEKLSKEAQLERNSYMQSEVALLREAQKRGEVRKDLAAETLQDFMEAVSISLVEQFILGPEKQNEEEQMRVLWGLVVGGIGGRNHARA